MSGVDVPAELIKREVVEERPFRHWIGCGTQRRVATPTLLKAKIMRNGQPVREKSTKKKAAPVKGGKTAPTKPRTASPRSNAPTIANGAATHANKTRQRILDVATQEFSAKGYD